MCSACNSKKDCNGGKIKLTIQYNRLTTLYNITTDNPTLKNEYSKVRSEIMEMMNLKDCPTEYQISVIQNYVNNEYTKHKNTH